MKTKKPLIGILANILTVEEGHFAGTERIYVNRDYVASVLRAGGTPILLPIIPDTAAIHQQIELLDGLVISGGQDVHPQHYSEAPAPWLETTCLERDLFELAAIRHAHHLHKPIFGICRGLQLMNVAFGGSLFQDIHNDFSKEALPHSQKLKKDEISQKVSLAEDSWLESIYGKNELSINSFHHQAIKDLAPGFQVSARAEDGIIEAIEKIDERFLLGVQWHPEMMTEKHSDMQHLFNSFVEQVSKRMIAV